MNRYSTLPPFPPSLSRLAELAVDVWWSWNREGRVVFRRLDYTLWRATAHNPVRMLRNIQRAKLEAAAADPAFVELYESYRTPEGGIRAPRRYLLVLGRRK